MKISAAPYSLSNRGIAQRPHMPRASIAAVAAMLLAMHLPAVYAQSACSSDATPEPQALFERFIDADCADCWADAATPSPGSSAAVIDWIVPSPAGADAALSAAARRDARERLESLHRDAPKPSDVYVSAAGKSPGGRLRVALGPAVNDYVGAVVSYASKAVVSPQADLTVWLALVEHIPAGADGAAVARNLVRGSYRANWASKEQLSATGRANLPRGTRWIDRVSMQIAPSADPSRLSLIGWLQNPAGEVVATAQTLCSERP